MLLKMLRSKSKKLAVRLQLSNQETPGLEISAVVLLIRQRQSIFCGCQEEHLGYKIKPINSNTPIDTTAKIQYFYYSENYQQMISGKSDSSDCAKGDRRSICCPWLSPLNPTFQFALIGIISSMATVLALNTFPPTVKIQSDSVKTQSDFVNTEIKKILPSKNPASR